MTKVLLTTLVLAVAACGSTTGDTDHPTKCAERAGSYRTTFAERDGTCGDMPEQLDTIDNQPTDVPSPCTGTIDYSADNCRVTSAAICPEDGIEPGVESTLESVTDWDASGDHGSGTAQIVVYGADGGILCQSTYDTEIERI